jgi:hypothetical protein
MKLSVEQIAFFKMQGYLLLPGVLDPLLCAQAQDAFWASLPDDSDIHRDDPATHVGPFCEKDTQRDPVNSRVGYRWQLRSNGTDQSLVDLMYSPALMDVAEQLLGKGRVRQPVVGGSVMGSRGYAWPNGPVDPALASEGIRGTYATLPYAEGESETRGDAGAHTDGHPFMLSMVGLIADSPPGGGAFNVWPGSHRRLFPTFWMRYDQARIPFYEHMPSYKGILHSHEYHEELARILEDTQPVDCWGSAGDVVVWHHRMVHAASENHSQVIRQAVLADFNRTDLDELRLSPPQEDMWQDWSDAVRESTGEYSQAVSLAQRCP